MGRWGKNILLIPIFLAAACGAYGSRILSNVFEIFSPANFILSPKQRPMSFRDLFSVQMDFSFIQKNNRTETDPVSPIADFSAEQSRRGVIRILMILWHGETDAERGFLAKLREMGYSPTPTLIDVDRNLKYLKQILRFEVNCEDYDYVYTFGTRVSLVVSEYVRNRVPIIFNAVSYPTKAWFMENDVGYNYAGNRGNFSGVGTSAPMAMQLKNMQKVLKVRRLAVLVNPKEQNGLDTLSMIEENAPSFGIAFKCFEVIDKEQLLPTLIKIKSTLPCFDAVYVTSGSPFTENSEVIFDFGCTEKIAMIGEKEDMIRDGALMGTVSKYEEGGKLAAKIVDMNWYYRIAMGHIPMQYPEFYCVINRKVAEILGFRPDPKKIDFQWSVARGQSPLDSRGEACHGTLLP
jgi:putative ABC transport system substrate-binding protein